jgi:serine/threonine protein phosphatase 1
MQERLADLRFMVVGDIHGCLRQLGVLLESTELHRGRQVIFLGDYVDIGEDPPGVIERLIAFGTERRETVFLQGNHDLGVLAYLRSGDFGQYAEAGGIATIRAYCGSVKGDVRTAFEQRIPRTHISFLQRLKLYFETKEYLFSHCGYSPDSPSDRSLKNMVLQSHQRLFENGATLGKLAVCGHYFQKSQEPFISDQVICLDTGCGILRGPLSALLLPEFQLVRVSTDLSLSVTNLGKATVARSGAR